MNVSETRIEGQKSYAVMLPCHPDQFGEFISGLLGKPQTITKKLYGSFNIDAIEIKNLYHLIQQRVAQQNGGSLIQFAVRIVYDDGSSILLNSFEDFENFHEVKALISRQVHLSWSYLIQFLGKSVPEKQDIEVSFYGNNGRSNMSAIDDDADGPLSPRFSYARGAASFRIKHTARTWGADIEALLSSHLDNIVVHDTLFRLKMRKNSGMISIFSFCAFFAGVIGSIIFAANHILDVQKDSLSKLLSNQDISVKLNSLLQIASAGIWERFFVSSLAYIGVGFGLSIAFAIFIESRLSVRPPSYILLTKAAKTEKELLDIRYKNTWSSIALTSLLSVALNLLSSYLYAQYWS